MNTCCNVNGIRNETICLGCGRVIARNDPTRAIAVRGDALAHKELIRYNGEQVMVLRYRSADQLTPPIFVDPETLEVINRYPDVNTYYKLWDSP